MTTAKPQQTAGQSDSADDLIAELAKLMAQDAQTDRPEPAPRPASAPAQPVPPAQAATPSVRIPGVSPEPQAAPVPTPGPRLDFGLGPQTASAPRQEPAFTPAAPRVTAGPDSFNFDFGLNTVERKAPEAEPAQTEPEPAPQPAALTPAAEANQTHDTIADLIAAELHTEPALQPVAPVPPQASGWAATAVAAVRDGQVEPVKPALRPVNLTPAPKPETDKFRVAPVFGLGTTPAKQADVPSKAPEAAPEPQAQAYVAPVASPSTPAAEAADAAPMDPIEEIESLIGRAMRVDLNGPSERPAPGPAPRSLATPTAPPAAPSRPSNERALSGADEAILAAAAATGAEIDWVNPVDGPEERPAAQRRGRKGRVQRAPGMARAFVGPLVAVALLLVAGFGLYWVLGLGRTDGPAPVLTADTAPVKQAPEAAPETAQAQQSVVFNEIDGVVPGAEEQLVSRDQADVNEVTRVGATDVSQEGLANRKVRTVTVRPDGTIVSGDEALAGAAILPVDRPNVPEVPGAEAASPDLLASASAMGTPAAPSAAAAAVTPTTTPTPAVTPVVPGSSVPVVDATGNPVAGKIAPVPYQRPASVGDAPAAGPTPTSPVNAVVDPVAALIEPAPAAAAQTAPAQAAPAQAAPAAAAPSTGPRTLADLFSGGQSQSQAPAPQAAAAPSGSNAPAYVQLASQRSEEDARATATQLASRFGSLFGGASLEVQRVDLGERGIYYRVRVPASSLQNATQICSSVKANGGDCFTM
jgi:hypothetical protein